MDDIITHFVQVSYTEETQEDIFQTLGLLQVFNYLEPYPVLHDIISMHSYSDPSVMVDDFMSTLLVSQQYLLDRHGVTLTDETTLSFNNTFLRVLLQLQKLDDPVPVLKILETDNDRVYKFCMIAEHLSSVPITTVLSLVEDVRPVCLELLAEFLYTQESNMEVARGQIPSIKENVKLFKEVFGINQAIQVIINSNVVMGEEFSLYRTLFDELRQIVSDENVLVETLLFLLLYSSDGSKDPNKVYEENADYLVSDLTIANRLGITLASMYTKMIRHKEKNQNEEK